MRYLVWYPFTAGPSGGWLRFRAFKSPVIPVKTLGFEPTSKDIATNWRVDGRSTSTAVSSSMIADVTWARVDSQLVVPPDARVDLEVTRKDDRVLTTVKVDSIVGRRKHLALRIVLLEDTIRLRGGTIRRVFQNVVRGYARSDQLPLGLAIPSTGSSTTAYAFDVAKLQAAILKDQNPKYLAAAGGDRERDSSYLIYMKESIAQFPDPADWRIDSSRLHVVAYVQDLTTGEVLQASRVKVPENGKVVRSVR
jgi:hypothetical protein